MLYDVLRSLIEKKAYEYNDMQNKLDIFFTFNRINEEEYKELSNMIKEG